MDRINNYAQQMRQAQKLFGQYDQQTLIQKLKLQADEKYFYVKLLCKAYRLDRATGELQRWEDTWVDANTHAEVMTLLDLICDSREDRYLSGRWKGMSAFGHLFHQNLLEEKNPFAEAIQADPESFRKACIALGGKPFPQGDIAYAIELFDGLSIAVQFWAGDEEFPARVLYLWDENARMYLKYETMYFAVGLLRARILEHM